MQTLRHAFPRRIASIRAGFMLANASQRQITRTIVKHLPFPQATAGFVITPRGEAAVGCASGPQALLDVQTGQIIARVPVSFVDIVATLGDHLFFTSYGSAPGQQPVHQRVPCPGTCAPL